MAATFKWKPERCPCVTGARIDGRCGRKSSGSEPSFSVVSAWLTFRVSDE